MPEAGKILVPLKRKVFKGNFNFYERKRKKKAEGEEKGVNDEN